MKRLSLAGLMLAAMCAFLAQAAQGDSKTFASPPGQGLQAWFLDMLKTLADTDDLTDPAKVSAILGVKFDKNVVTTKPSHMESSPSRLSVMNTRPPARHGSQPASRAMHRLGTGNPMAVTASSRASTLGPRASRSISNILSPSASDWMAT